MIKGFFICQKTVPAIFEKKAFVAITSVALKIKLESRKWPRCPAPGAPGLRYSFRNKILYVDQRDRFMFFGHSYNLEFTVRA